MSNTELAFLKKNLAGPILRITDPRVHSREEILKSYFREILVIARSYTRPTVEFEDLVVEGLMGLLDAVARWDPEKSKGKANSFHNLAIVRIKSNMFEYFLANSSAYSTPNYMARAMLLLNQVRGIVQEFESVPGSESAVGYLECPEFEASIPADVRAKIRSLKEKLNNLAQSMGKSYEDMIAGVLRVEEDIRDYEVGQSEEVEESPEDIASRQEFLEKVLAGLAPDARDVLFHLMEGKTLEEVGEEMGFTRERARQIKEGALRFLSKTRMFKDAIE